MTSAPVDYFPALLQHLQGHPQEAGVLLEQAAREHATDPRPLLLLAGGFMHQGQTDRAEGAYIVALQRDPRFAIARFQLGLLRLTSARPAAALATWAPLEQLPESDPLRLFKRGIEAMVLGRNDEARRWIEEGIERNLANPPLTRDMQMLLDRMESGQGGEAGTGGKPQSAPAGEPGATPAGSAPADHFLVSAYRTSNH